MCRSAGSPLSASRIATQKDTSAGRGPPQEVDADQDVELARAQARAAARCGAGCRRPVLEAPGAELHSEVVTLRRIELLRELRSGEFDVLVGINLLREGLDLPEVSLVAILDADKEGFLRSGTSLSRPSAARRATSPVRSTCTPTRSPRRWRRPSRRPTAAGRSRSRTTRRTASTPSRSARNPNDIVAQIAREDVDTEQLLGSGYRKGVKDGKGARPRARARRQGGQVRQGQGQGRGAEPTRPAAELAGQIEEMTERMRAAAADLQFEVAPGCATRSTR